MRPHQFKIYFKFLLLGFLLSFVYTNCSQYSDSQLDLNSLLDASDGGTAGVGFQGIRVGNDALFVACYNDHTQIGGACNVGKAKFNRIRYRIYYDRNPVFWCADDPTPPSLSSPCVNQVFYLDESKCENGQFFAIVPKPFHSALNGGSNYLEYQVQFEILTSDDGVDFRSSLKSPMVPISIQQNGPCGG
jgi:hypothetical protein